MSAKVVLQVISGPIQGKVFEFDKHDTFVFGRGKECHAKLPKDGYVARHHLLLGVNPLAATIRDLGSTNGTHVNGYALGRPRPADSRQECLAVLLRLGVSTDACPATAQVRFGPPRGLGRRPSDHRRLAIACHPPFPSGKEGKTGETSVKNNQGKRARRGVRALYQKTY